MKIITENNKYNWVKTEATIEKIKLLETPNPSFINDINLYETFPNKTCEIIYKYTFNGVDYFNDEIGIRKKKLPKNDSHFSDTNQFHSKLFEKLKNEKKVLIYVNAIKPENSSLIKYDFDLKKIGSALISLTFSIFIALFLLINFKYKSAYISNQIKTYQ